MPLSRVSASYSWLSVDSRPLERLLALRSRPLPLPRCPDRSASLIRPASEMMGILIVAMALVFLGVLAVASAGWQGPADGWFGKLVAPYDLEAIAAEHGHGHAPADHAAADAHHAEHGRQRRGGGAARKTYDTRAGECGAHSMLVTAFCRAVAFLDE